MKFRGFAAMRRKYQEFLPLIGLLLALGMGSTVRAGEPATADPPAATVAAPHAPKATAPAPATPAAKTAASAGLKPAPSAGAAAPASEGEEAKSAVTPAPSEEDVVAVGHDAELPAGHTAGSVVAIFGNATSAGDAHDAVVAVFGDTHVSGVVHDAAVAVFGSNHVDAKVKGDAVAVFGDLELGPQAEIDGDAVAVGGTLHRDPAAIVHGQSQSILPGAAHLLDGLRPWFRHCLLYMRPLAFAPGLGWAWGLAFGFLALYALLALLAGHALERCAATLETRPGQTLLASLLAVLLVPVLIVLLCITVIGLAVVPFLGLALMAATLFGKAVVLATLGRLLLREAGRGDPRRTALAVIVGGFIVMALYCIPVIGFIVFKLVGVIGVGAVLYTLFLSTRSRGSAAEAPRPDAPSPAAAAAPAAAAEPASSTAGGGAGEAAAGAGAPRAAQPAILLTALPRAGFWVRMGALFIDFILVAVAASIIRHDGHLIIVGLMAYGAIMWKLRGTTIGGIVCGLRVVRADGRPLDWPTSVVRALSCLLSMVVAGIGFFWIAFDSERQAWHDKIAGTLVVRAPSAQPLV
jgi:uncharacterized RDD family membrane protein YckC